jgi:hypothetical protein
MATPKAVHKAAAVFHAHQAAKDGVLAECYGSLAKAAGELSSEDSKMWKTISDTHAKSARSNEDAAAFHSAAMADCDKAEKDALNKIVPDGISGIPRSDVPAGGFGIRAIPRAGMPDPSGLDKGQIDSINPMFRHLVQTNED